jgi:septum formation protein
MEPIILASGSLQRQEYFRLLGLPFNIISPGVDESYDPGLSPQEVTETLARRKVKKVVDMLRGRNPPWICGADTVVSVEGSIFGKPADREEARSMLTRLQGRDHEVVSAIALYNGQTKAVDCRSVISTVSFAPLGEGDIEWYLNTGEWQEGAGGYKIQGLAACLISEIRGSYSGIVGLPLREFYVMLIENGYPYGE